MKNKLKILSNNSGEEIVLVAIGNFFVYVTDYGAKAFLKEIIVSYGQHHWEWVSFNRNIPVDIIDIGNKYSSFDNALNRAVNDPYRTVYEFRDMEEAASRWEDIKYVDNIKTKYVSQENSIDKSSKKSIIES